MDVDAGTAVEALGITSKRRADGAAILASFADSNGIGIGLRRAKAGKSHTVRP
jgi:hypothetical protein